MLQSYVSTARSSIRHHGRFDFKFVDARSFSSAAKSGAPMIRAARLFTAIQEQLD